MIKKIYTIQEIQEKLKPIFEARNINKAILFGSYAKGKATSVSDVDLMVDVDVRGWNYYGLLDDIIQALKKDVDLILLNQIKLDTKMYNEIHETGIVIYDKENPNISIPSLPKNKGSIVEHDIKWLSAIVDLSNKVLEFVDGIDCESFMIDEKTYMASSRVVQEMGYCVDKVSKPIKESHNQIPWKKMRDFENRIHHDFENVSEQEVWDFIQLEIPKLIDNISEILKITICKNDLSKQAC